jgi:histidinol-phosphate/aromatic aminotransferase/cobyric acid decarboxylase-like protein
MLSPRQAVRTLPSYHPPLAGRNGLRLDFNENTVGCSPRVLECLRQLGSEQLARYPERAPVEAKVAEFLGIAAPELLLTNGVDEAIHLLCETYLEAGDEALIVVPTYSMYRIYAMAAGAQMVPVPAGKDFLFPADDVFSRISPRTRLIAIANPNNPTGTVAPREDLLRISARGRSVFRILRAKHAGCEQRIRQSVCGPHFFQGIWSGGAARGSAGRQCRANARSATGQFTLQRKRGGPGLLAGGPRRPGVH